MKIVQIPNYGPVSFPDNFSDEEIKQKAQQISTLAEAKYGYKPDYREQGLGALIKSGFGRSVASLGTTFGDVIPAMAASALGFKDYARRQMEEAAQSQQEIEEKYPTAYKSYKDVRGLGDVPGYVAETVGELAPDMLAMLTGAGAGSAVGRRLATKGVERAAAASVESALGTQRGMQVGLYGSSFTLNAPDTFQGIYDKTGNLEPGIAVAFGAAQALLDSVTPARLLQQFSPAARARVANELIQQSTVVPPSIKAGIARQLIKTGTIEAGTEGAQELLGILAERTAGAQGDIFSPDNLDRMLNASIKGLVGGAVFGAPGAVSEAVQDKRAAQQELAQRAAQAAQQGMPPGEAPPAVAAPPEVPLPPGPPAGGGIAQLLAPQLQPQPGPQLAIPPQPQPQPQPQPPAPIPAAAPAPVAAAPAPAPLALPVAQPTPPAPPGETYAQPATAPAATAAGQPAGPVVGEGVPVPVRPVGEAASAGVAPPQPPGVVRGTEPTQPAVSRAGEPLAPLTDSAAIDQDIRRIISEKEKLVTKAGHAPSPRNPNRVRFDALDRELTQRKAEWQKVTGTDWNVVQMEKAQGAQAAPAAPPVAPAAPPVAPAAPPVAAPAAPTSVEEQIRDLKAKWSEAAARGDSEAARKLNDQIVALKAQAAPAAAAPIVPPAPPATPLVAAAPKPKAVKPAAPAPKPAPNLTGAEARFATIMREGFAKNKGKATTDTDTAKVAALNASKETTPEAKAARAYFSKSPNVVDALDMIGFDLANPDSTFRRSSEGDIEASFSRGMGSESAKLADDWVRKNLSPKANEMVKGFRKQYAKEAASGSRFRKKLEIQQEGKKQAEAAETEAKQEEFKKTRLSEAIPEDVEPDSTDMDIEDWMATREYYKLDEAAKLATPLHPIVRHALYHGDLQQALRFLAQSDQPSIAKMARALMQADISPNIVTQNNLRDPAGKEVPGYYDPKTNTIYLDSVRGMNSHVLFHEIGHAAMSHVIADPGHPVTKQLAALFGNVKPSLDTAYGAQNLQEFVAEAWANDEFKAKLNAINPMGGEITAWQRFTNVVQNFFRRLFGLESKPIESAFDQTDKLIKAILSTAPLSRDSELLYAAVVHPKGSVAEAALEAVAKAATKLPGATEAWGDNVDHAMRTFGRGAKNLLLLTMPSHALTDVAKKHLPMAGMFNTLVRLKQGDENARNEKVDAVISIVERWAKANAKHVDALNKVIYDSTIYKVDPTKARAAYENKFPNDPKLQATVLEIYDRLHKELTNIPGGKEIYTRMRDTYAEMYEEVKRLIGVRVDSAVENEGVRNKLKTEIYARLAEKGDIDPYFPLTRNGEFWMSYSAVDDAGQTEYFVRAFETERERERTRAEVEAAGAKDVRVFSKLSAMSYKNVPPTSFVHNVLKLMELNRPEESAAAAQFDTAMEQIMRMFLSTLPEKSFAQAFHRREGIAGYNRDAVRALREKSYSMSRQLTNMKYAAEFNKLRREMEQHLRKISQGPDAVDNQVAKEYFDELDKRIDFAISPTTVSKASRMMASLGFNYLLGFNISSAVVQLAQVPMIVMPYLGGKYGYGATGRAINEAYRVFVGSGFTHDVEIMGAKGEKLTRRSMPSLDNIDFADPKLHVSLKKYETLARVARELNMLNRSQFQDALDMDGRKSPLQTVNALSGAAFHHGERMTRQVSLMAAYNLELQRLNDPKRNTKEERQMSAAEKEEAAANQAIYLTELTNGGTGAEAAPRIAQNSIGKVLFMFKTYGVAMNYLLFKTARELSRDQPPEVRKAAFKQMAGILGSSALFAGLQGMPLFGVVAMLYNLFKDDDDEDFGSVMRTYTGETAYKGVINSVTGLSIAERIGLSNLIIREDPFSAGAASMADTFAQIVGGPIYGVASRVQRGMQLMHDGYTERGIESMVPVAMANIFKAHRYATEGATTLRGDPLIGDISAWNVGAQLFGFAPAEYTQQLEVNSMLKGIEKAVSQQQTKLLQRIYVSNSTGDIDGFTDAYQKLGELYAKHPALGNVNETIRRSLEQQRRISQEKFHGLTLPKKLGPELRSLAAEMGVV